MYVPRYPGPLCKRLYSPYFDDEFPHVRRVRWLSLWGGLKQSLTVTRLTLMEREVPPSASSPVQPIGATSG